MGDVRSTPDLDYLERLLAALDVDRAELSRRLALARESALPDSRDEIIPLLQARLDGGFALFGRLVLEGLHGDQRARLLDTLRDHRAADQGRLEPAADEPAPAEAPPAEPDTPTRVAISAEEPSGEPPPSSPPVTLAPAATPAGEPEPIEPSGASPSAASLASELVPFPTVSPAARPPARTAQARAAAPSPPPPPRRPVSLTDDHFERLRAGLGPKIGGGEPGRFRKLSEADRQEMRLSLKAIGRTPSGVRDRADIEAALEMLDDAAGYLLHAWAHLPADCNHALTSLLVCRARATQEAALSLEANAQASQLNALFPRLSRHSADSRPGLVHGLARWHTPQHGTWLDDAREWERQVRTLADPDLPVAPHTAEHAVVAPRLPPLMASPSAAHRVGRPRPGTALKPKVTRGSRPREIPDLLPADWPLRSVVARRRAVLVGGDPRPEAAERLQRAFGLTELQWIPSVAGGAGRRIDSLLERMRNGTVDLVIVLRAFTSHKVVEKVFAVEAPNCPRVLADSYGVTQVRLGLERFLGRREIA